jgi:1,6-anhydro-N-acetylmuramate kinase
MCHAHGGDAFDSRREAITASGTPDAALLRARCCMDPWFDAPAPKSTGREQFQLRLVVSMRARLQDPEPSLADGRRGTLAQTEREPRSPMPSARGAARSVVLACGRAACTTATLMRAIGDAIAPVALETTAATESTPIFSRRCFAWLAAGKALAVDASGQPARGHRWRGGARAGANLPGLSAILFATRPASGTESGPPAPARALPSRAAAPPPSSSGQLVRTSVDERAWSCESDGFLLQQRALADQ